MKHQGLDHLAIAVPGTEAALKLWRDALGFKVLYSEDVNGAMVPGQILPGVPVWEPGAETKFPGRHYVVFPGNVGGPDALAEAVNQFDFTK